MPDQNVYWFVRCEREVEAAQPARRRRKAERIERGNAVGQPEHGRRDDGTQAEDDDHT